ncbi:MAG TPA: amidohydrolase family protein [Hanamia sp.]|nr:amidohydrolase family protein [Hanamia sp.]
MKISNKVFFVFIPLVFAYVSFRAAVISTSAKPSLDEFLKGQPVIDVHLHATKGFTDNDAYNKLDKDITLAKIKWTSSELDSNHIVLALAGGVLANVKKWTAYDKRYWGGLIFPASKLVEQDQPYGKEFYTYSELKEIYKDTLFRFLGESMYSFCGIPPTDPRLDDYWRFAEVTGLPLGIHSDTGPPPAMMNKKERPNNRPDYADPKLLEPVLKKYPHLHLYFMHYGGRYSDQMLTLMKKYPQIYCDMTAVTLFGPKPIWEPKIKRLFAEGLGNRLMFGSDYSGTIRKNLEIVYALDWLTDQQKRDIYYNNAARFLKLSDAQIEAHRKMVQE